MEEVEAAQLPLVLQEAEGPIQKVLSVPYRVLTLLREMRSHLEHRK